LLFQKQSALALWYQARTADNRVGTRKTMIVALARKLLIALWRLVTTGETLEGVILRPAERVGNVDVVIGEEDLGSAAQQGGEMPRHWRYQENARLRSGLLLEAQQRTKRRLINRRLAYHSLATADRDGVNAESRPAMTEARARDKLAEGRSGAQESMARHPWHRLDERRGGQLGDRPNRCGDGQKKLGNYGKSWA
jgi:hypothetical protein